MKDTSQFNEDFMKTYNEESDGGYFLETLHELHNDLPFSLEKMKTEKVRKLAANLHYKTEYVIHISNLKQTLSHRFVLKHVYRVIKLNRNAWLKPYIDMTTDLRKKAKNGFEKYLFKLMNKAVFVNL